MAKAATPSALRLFARRVRRAALAAREPLPVPLWHGERWLPGRDVPRLTPYLARGRTPVGAVLVCPGGGYVSRTAHEGAPVARWLNTLGLAAFVLHYRVAPHPYPAPLLDAQRALRLIRSRAAAWRVRPNRVAILGFSAGGHLAATVAVQPEAGCADAADPVERASCRPDALILCYPVISCEEHDASALAAYVTGGAADAATCRAHSPDRFVTAATPPTFLWHTAQDREAPVAHSRRFAQALAAHGVPHALHVFPRGGHGLGLAAGHPSAGAWTALCAAWLAEQGFTAQ